MRPNIGPHVHEHSIIGPYCVHCGQNWQDEWNPPESVEKVRREMNMVLEDFDHKRAAIVAHYEDRIRKAEAGNG